MRNLRDGDILDTIIRAIEDGSPDSLCRNCPVIQLIRDIADRVSEREHREIAKELGIEFSPKKCPCFEKFKDQK